MEKHKHQKQYIPFSALGLIFGTALGAALALLIGVELYWAGAGTGIGLITGAAIDSMRRQQ